jgi:hypothetical protein
MSEWQPIETAPKDRAILLWLSHYRAPVLGRWCNSLAPKSIPSAWVEYGAHTRRMADGSLAEYSHWCPIPEFDA